MMFAGHLFLKIEELQHFALYQGRAIIIVNYYLLPLIHCPSLPAGGKAFSVQLLL